MNHESLKPSFLLLHYCAALLGIYSGRLPHSFLKLISVGAAGRGRSRCAIDTATIFLLFVEFF